MTSSVWPALTTPWGTITPTGTRASGLTYANIPVTPTGVTITVMVYDDHGVWAWWSADHTRGGSGFRSLDAALTHLCQLLHQHFGTPCTPTRSSEF
ncbi:hypothetical protein SAMN00768000_3652 [Sulfobacillus thermosulfidooxidans DSM 9293]|uniref:Uncharacterized protein n=2 Tax=Sulfobacillus thermosulfidooxidans TaxID=28034 RepID=A0A1W1WP69_SULTA|nr:hypothetical protein [Sulfobacillus thermosulfidooxidans]PSR21934.1 MAG: hypothetical protein C7B47_17015 [Sulfobacillus thermosulfidooxidans]SMC08101.1 hypothetical protein SAMN00768000_3652 [Sulfobacillus thermosulfidooxidans DSM 9293]